VKRKHENDYVFCNSLSKLDTSRHCNASGVRIPRRHVLPREGLRKRQQVLELVFVESGTRDGQFQMLQVCVLSGSEVRLCGGCAAVMACLVCAITALLAALYILSGTVTK